MLLLDEAKPDIFKKNVFRITGLPVYATEKEIKKSAENQKIKEELGVKVQDEKRSFPLVPPAGPSQIQEAMTRLRDPQTRVVDELFWFWPISDNGSDAAFQCFMKGDSDSAFNHWTQGALVSKSSISSHNLAVMFQLTAMDWTNYQLEEDVSAERAEKIRTYWQNAHEKWKEVNLGDGYWSTFRARVASLNEPMLTTGFTRRIIRSLPLSLASIHAEYAIRFLTLRKQKLASEHVELLKRACDDQEEIQYVISRALGPIRNRLKSATENLQENVKSNTSNGDQLVMAAITSLKELKQYFSLFGGSNEVQIKELLDQACITILRSLDIWVEKLKNHEKYLTILGNVEVLATGKEVLDRIKNDQKWARNQINEKRLAPGFDLLKKILESKESAKLRLNIFKDDFMPILARLAESEQAGSESLVLLSDRAAVTVRSIGIDSYNNDEDIATSSEAIRLARLLAKDPKLKERIEEDNKTLEENKKLALCHFCGKNAANKNKPRMVAMHGEVYKILNTKHFKHLEVKVPQCNDCEGAHSRNEGISWILAIIAFAIATIAMPPAFFLWILGAIFVRYIVSSILESTSFKHSKSEYSGVKELLNKGWSFGSKPS